MNAPIESDTARPKLEVLVEHLSSEIKVHTEALHQFRSRVNLPVFLGPFVLIGYLAGSDSRIKVSWDGDALIPALVVVGSFLFLGYTCAVIERHTWKQCNVWRRQIQQIYTNPEDALPLIIPDPPVKRTTYFFPESLRGTYLLVYTVLLAAVWGVVALLKQWLVVADAV
jgi:hypothetical protein